MKKQETVVLKIKGMTCDSCAIRIRKILQRETGVNEVQASLAEGTAVVRFNPRRTTIGTILNSRAFNEVFRVKDSNGEVITHRYTAEPFAGGAPKSRSNR